MKDTASIGRVALLHPKIRTEVEVAIDLADLALGKYCAIRIVQGLRTIEEQNALYAQGRTTPGKKVTNAKGGSSYHNYGLAVDFALLYDKDKNGTFEALSWDTAADMDKNGVIDWQAVVNSFIKLGYEWGGSWRTFKDLPHIQKTFGFNWRQLLEKYNKKDFIPGTRYVNI